MFNKIFRKRDHKESSMLPVSVEENTLIPFQERPRICLIDIDSDAKDALTSDGLNCVNGSLGSLIKLPNHKYSDKCFCRLDDAIPQNLHEYDIVIIDLKDREPIQYDAASHLSLVGNSAKQSFLLCEFPQTIFDPRPLTGYMLRSMIVEIQKKESIIIVFASEQKEISYNSVIIIPEWSFKDKQFKYDNYSFLPDITSSNNRTGIETKVISGNVEFDVEFTNFLQKYNQEFIYEITFQHPAHWDNWQSIKDSDFIPLITNSGDEIISYAKIYDSSILFVFPQLENKVSFLLELFQRYLPAIKPKLFPFSTQFLWLKDQEYQLPNEANLYSEKQSLEKEFEEKIATKELEINENHQKYQFLHDLLTETDKKLVKSVELFFHWLEFDCVVNCDEVYPERNEEDLQITLDNGLLVVEVKGIGGTSKDSECSQISKIKHRYQEERKSFDVFALYIVNHQRHQPPENRSNPPFIKQQIKDAVNDGRGLLTTYTLFKLYYAIAGGFISKDDARKSLLNFGLVTFSPSDSVLIGKPMEIHYNKTVGIFLLENIPIRRGEELFVYSDGRYCKTKVVSLQDQDEDVEEASSGKIGIKISGTFSQESELWKPKTVLK